ncbi:hypothetical protein QWZ13_15965 [Reinekea marina]|nr:hypothetical protein [Reinekea marina]MDN3650404.1 hypothetical protein [Reinekea marina]
MPLIIKVASISCSSFITLCESADCVIKRLSAALWKFLSIAT